MTFNVPNHSTILQKFICEKITVKVYMNINAKNLEKVWFKVQNIHKSAPNIFC